VAKTHWRKANLFNNWYEENWLSTCRRLCAGETIFLLNNNNNKINSRTRSVIQVVKRLPSKPEAQFKPQCRKNSTKKRKVYLWE
jgi:hypothetical protein